MPVLIALLLSFGPALVFAWIVYTLDRYEKEPKLLLGGVFVWGAVVSVVFAAIVEILVELGVTALTGSEALASVTGASIVAPIVEESVKGFAVLMVFLLFRREFDSYLDGIVYAGIVALGFAATENAGYLLFKGYDEGGYPGMLILFLIRVILGGWDHPFYTSFIGLGLAAARMSRGMGLKLVAPVVGWGFAVAAHAFKNGMISLFGGAGFLLSLLANWAGWLFMLGLIVWAILRERRMLRLHLRAEVEAGLLTGAQYATACSVWRPTIARLSGLFSGRWRVSSRFYQVCGELAHKREQLQRFGEEGGNSQIIARLREELARLAPQAVTG